MQHLRLLRCRNTLTAARGSPLVLMSNFSFSNEAWKSSNASFLILNTLILQPGH